MCSRNPCNVSCCSNAVNGFSSVCLLVFIRSFALSFELDCHFVDVVRSCRLIVLSMSGHDALSVLSIE